MKTIILSCRKLLLALSAAAAFCPAAASDVVWYDGKHPVAYNVLTETGTVVGVALEMFSGDMKAVTGHSAVAASPGKASISVVQLDNAGKALRRKLAESGVDVEALAGKTDGFHISALGGKITVVGSNARGTAYGVLELSRLAGVSPWVWWGDLVPERKERLTLDSAFSTMQGASVEYRGIFLNDEDWTTRPWSHTTFAPAKPGTIAAATYSRIFRLLLRLRANAVWPAMHEGTVAFFDTPGAKAAADSCGMTIGTSHCEPLLRNNVGEWDTRKRGRFNFISNRRAVEGYWAERLEEVKASTGNMFTIGMRGIHDGSMEGVRTMDEKFAALQDVIDTQQKLIARHVGKPEEQMQVFVPYKEVLQIYEQGLNVPDHVTLMWCDDNYGYITRLSDEAERRRSGGAGIYYHLSYWGRPHDHLWLTTTQPGLIYNEMRQAYDHGVRKLWIANVHDLKVAGYDLELFLDMAWDIDCVSGATLGSHYKAWLCRQFGAAAGEKLYPAMHEFFRLCGQRKPEFMGWNQVELDKRIYHRGLSPVGETELSTSAFGNEFDRYLERYAAVADAVGEAEALIRPELADAYFAAVKYPVMAAAAHAQKILEAQRARSLAAVGTTEAAYTDRTALHTAVARSQAAYSQVRRLTDHYNNTMSGGKWRGLMDMAPRSLPVFAAPALPLLLSDDEVERMKGAPYRPGAHPTVADGAIARNASDYDSASEGAQTIAMLGHSMSAVALPEGGTLTYHFTTAAAGEATVHTALIPTQPVGKGDLRYSVSIDGGEPVVFSLKEKFRSEGWKANVLRGQARRTHKVRLEAGRHTMVIKALDSHIVADQWMIDFKAGRKFYLFPTE